MKKFAALLLAAAMTLPAFSAQAAEGLTKEYSFNVGSSSTAGTTITKTFEAVQQEAPEVSDGKLSMTYFGASSLGTDKEMLTECIAGNLPNTAKTSFCRSRHSH